MNSISRFLVVALLIAVTAVVSVVSYWSYREATHEVEELFDAELAQMARVLQSLLESQLQRTQITQLQQALRYRPYHAGSLQDPDQQEATPRGHKYESKLAFQVWNADGEALIGSKADRHDLQFSRAKGYGLEQIGDFRWRTFTLNDPSLQLWIKVAQRSDVRGELSNEIVISNLLPSVFMIPLLGLLIWLIIRRGLSPLKQISCQITDRDPDHLQPLDTANVPQEISAVVSATNQLMSKLADALQRERRFTADAAHELRTPLAAIRVHAQNLAGQAGSSRTPPAPSAQPQSLEHIIQGVDRMTHVVEQLLTLSRLEYQQQPPQQRLDLAPLLRGITAAQAQQALDKQQRLELQVEGAAWVRGHAPSLEILCRNLIDNAIRYTPASGTIRISLQPAQGRLRLAVCDNGPGIAEEEKQRVLQRFYRLEHQQISGSGLGLAIVQEIAEQHQACLLLMDSIDSPQGLTVCVDFKRLDCATVKGNGADCSALNGNSFDGNSFDASSLDACSLDPRSLDASSLDANSANSDSPSANGKDLNR